MEQHFEREPILGADIVDILHEINDDEVVVLSREKVEVFANDGSKRAAHLVDYSDLNKITDEFSESFGFPVESRLMRAARNLSNRGEWPAQGPAFPTLKVTNYLTGETTSRQINVASLLVQGDLSVKTFPAPSSVRGVSLISDLSDFSKRLAAEVGIEKNPMVFAYHDGVRVGWSLCDVSPKIVTHIPNHYGGYAGLPILQIDEPEMTEVTLAEMQMQFSRQFMNSHHCRTALRSNHIEVELEVIERPNLQEAMLELIKTVELTGYRLGFRREDIKRDPKITTSREDKGFVFSVVDEYGNKIAPLEGNSELYVAICNARWASEEAYGAQAGEAI